MATIIENIQKKTITFFPSRPMKEDLPISSMKEKAQPNFGLRRRLSSLSLHIQPLHSASSAWAFRRSKSMSSFGESAGGSLRRWWEWGWGWILSRKPYFTNDLEMNEEESHMLGCHNKGSWRHVFYKVRAEFRRLVRSEVATLPIKGEFRYDSFSYAQNFDDGKRRKSDE
ncbi:hypothetical protein QJS04_geneDACA010409 [Acorus gramineus]|uniref:Uncharacterized protein n=1 Tax=Acorus gramineus TaxID=55184 RepID=A0AAV9A639_ACOGR|nr:hypothetical protein QJS04_geneDACA010409 [Acorus gramineus]